MLKKDIGDQLVDQALKDIEDHFRGLQNIYEKMKICKHCHEMKLVAMLDDIHSWVMKQITSDLLLKYRRLKEETHDRERELQPKVFRTKK